MKLTRILLSGLLVGLPLVLGGCLKLEFPWEGSTSLIYYPQEPRVCPEGIYVGLELPKDARVFSVLYTRLDGENESVPMLTATSFLMNKPAEAPSTPEEAEAGVAPWRGFYVVGLQLKDEPVGLNFHCQGSGRTASERATVAKYNWADFVVVENPSRDSGIEVRRVP